MILVVIGATTLRKKRLLYINHPHLRMSRLLRAYLEGLLERPLIRHPGLYRDYLGAYGVHRSIYGL